MKKIININLSGRVIPIEDSAYEKLQAYIESLRRYFINEEGRDEIINDIESRIAELMSDKVRLGSSAITDSDIDGIMTTMGRPEDFDAVAAEEAPVQSQPNAERGYAYTEKKPRGRLYRDTSDKFLGGVCSGIASYLNIDPSIVRILFAILGFGGFGILLYVLLWIFLPTKDLEGYSGKRLYRNPDDRVLGGVAGGLAAYFNRRSSTIRLIFVAPLLLNILFGIFNGALFSWHRDIFPNIFIGSFTGTFIFVYVVLWMLLPEARNQYEKMEMRGETVDVNSIRQNVKEGMENMKEKMKGWGQEVKESAKGLGGKAKEFTRSRGKVFVAESGETVRRTRNSFGQVIGVLFKVFFLIVAGSIAFGLFIALIALLFGGIAWWPVNNFLWTSHWQQLYAWGTLIFFIGVPLIAFITWVIRRIIRVRSRSSYLGWTFGGLWVIGWIAAALFAASITRDFRYYDHSDTSININQPPKGKLIIKVSQPEIEYSGNFGWMNDSRGFDISDDTMKISAIRFNYIKSEDSLFHLTLKKYCGGRTHQEALERADKIQYFISSADSTLDVGSGYAIDSKTKFRGQKVEIEIRVPVGRKIRFDETVPEKLNTGRFHIYHLRRNSGRGRLIFEDSYVGYPWRSGVDYTMGSDGELKGPAGEVDQEGYRYENEDSIRVKPETLDEREKRWEEEGKKIKEEKQKQQKPTSKAQAINNKDNAIACSPSPVFSLVNVFN